MSDKVCWIFRRKIVNIYLSRGDGLVQKNGGISGGEYESEQLQASPHSQSAGHPGEGVRLRQVSFLRGGAGTPGFITRGAHAQNAGVGRGLAYCISKIVKRTTKAKRSAGKVMSHS